jgi:hypothetical protein
MSSTSMMATTLGQDLADGSRAMSEVREGPGVNCLLSWVGGVRRGEEDCPNCLIEVAAGRRFDAVVEITLDADELWTGIDAVRFGAGAVLLTLDKIGTEGEASDLLEDPSRSLCGSCRGAVDPSMEMADPPQRLGVEDCDAGVQLEE